MQISSINVDYLKCVDRMGRTFGYSCSQAEEEKRRAERDKLAAITALEERSREFMREKKLKEKLEKKINTMQSQLLLGGHKIENTPAFRILIDREHKRIRGAHGHTQNPNDSAPSRQRNTRRN